MVFGRGIGLSYGDWRTRATQDLFGSVLCVLLVRFSSIGDILLTTPLVRALARRHPEAKLVYVTKDRKSTRLNSSHRCISYAGFCLKKKKQKDDRRPRI